MEDCNLETSLQRLTSLQHHVIYSWPWGQVGGGGAGAGFHTDTLWWRNSLFQTSSHSRLGQLPKAYTALPLSRNIRKDICYLHSLQLAPWAHLNPDPVQQHSLGHEKWNRSPLQTAHLIVKMSFNVDHQNRLLPTPILPCSLAIRHLYVAEVQLSTASIFY